MIPAEGKIEAQAELQKPQPALRGRHQPGTAGAELTWTYSQRATQGRLRFLERFTFPIIHFERPQAVKGFGCESAQLISSRN